ncbi:MAG: mandelate racemase/muconate lactonizing enzyme family protein [bacterium]
MRITAVEFRELKVPYGPEGYQPSWLPGVTQHVFPQSLVRLFTDEGHVGISSTNCFGDEVIEANSQLAPMLLGMRLDTKEDLRNIWVKLLEKKSTVDPPSMLGITLEEAGKQNEDKSVNWGTVLCNLLREPTKIGLFKSKNIQVENRFGYLDVALWDLLGKQKGLPIADLLGKKRDRIRAYVSTGEVISPEIVEFVDDCQAEGFDCVKLRVNDPDTAGTEFNHLREVIENYREIEVGVDANQGWSLLPPYWSRSDAMKAGRVMNELGVSWLEEPLGCLDTTGIKQLSDELEIEIVGGELEAGVERFNQLIKAYDTLNPDVCMSTGLSEGQSIATTARENGVEYTPHTWDLGPGVAAGVQLACAIENCTRLEYPWDPSWPVEYRDSILESPIEASNGHLELPEQPGLGVSLDMDYVRDHTVRTVRLGDRS